MAHAEQFTKLGRERDVITAAACEAGSLLLERAPDGRQVDFKSDIDLVTDADHASETLIVEAIRDAFPNDVIVAEEGRSATGPGDSGRTWLIDPLDGTTNYAHQFPIWAISIALLSDGRARLGVVYVPPLDEMFIAVHGEGATLNGSPIAVSATQDLGQAMLATGFAYNLEERRENLPLWDSFVSRSRAVRRVGAAAYDLCCVACGRFDGYWERGTSAWDVAAGSLLVSEAGGKVSNYRGGPFDPFSREVVAGNPAIHSELVATIMRIRAEDRA